MKRINFLFWNIKDQISPFEKKIQKLVSEHKINVLILAENDNIPIKNIELETNLSYFKYTKRPDVKPWTYIFHDRKGSGFGGFDILNAIPAEVCDKQIINSSQLARYLEKEERLSAYILTVNGRKYLLFTLHYPSKLCCSNRKQYVLARKMKDFINNVEQETKIYKSIIVGDFNMNPFEEGMLGPDAFNASLSCNFAKWGKKIYDIKHSSFYNPSWALSGDFYLKSGIKKSPGTHYYDDMGEEGTYWQLFDQIIFRPDLHKQFIYNSIDLITGFKKSRYAFLDKDGIPNSKDFSDHLPIKFSFNL